MRFTKILFAVAAAASFATVTATASAEDSPRLAAVREGMRDISLRTKAVRDRAAKSPPQLKHECSRIVDEVEKKRKLVAIRLDVYSLLGKNPSDEASLRAVEEPYHDADKLLSTVESWYQPH